MVTFHYIICSVPKKEKYHVKKLVFVDQKLEQTDELYFNNNQINTLKNEIEEKDITIIEESKVDLDSFLKYVNLTKII